MTRIKSGFASHLLFLAFVSFFGLSQSALAAPCTAEVDALKAALNDDICSYSSKCKGLSHKLDKVNRKLEKGKLRKAARKLADFGAIIENMTMRKKPKISMADYEALIDPYFNNAAICIANGGVIETADDTGSNLDEDDFVDGTLNPEDEAF
jgi:hypothetical protein